MPGLLDYASYLPPDLTHDVSHILIRTGVVRAPRISLEMPVELGNIELRNPLGLGAGIDKDAFLASRLLGMGLGFITIGSVTLRPRPGNPRPRAVRYPRFRAMVNAMGLPSRGFVDVVGRVKQLIGKSRDHGTKLILSLAGFSVEEFLLMAHGAEDVGVDALEINISSPTYKGSWVKDTGQLRGLLKSLEEVKVQLHIKIPLGIDAGLYRFIVMEAGRRGFGLTIANTLMVKEPRISVGYGGLSGLPIYPLVKALIAKVRRWGFQGPIIGIGGVFYGKQVLELMRTGANAVGVVTAFAYEGPWAFSRLSNELVKAKNTTFH